MKIIHRYVPEVRFELAPIDLEADLLYSFSKPGDRFTSVMNKVYPELEDIVSKPRDKNDVISDIKQLAETVIGKDKKAIGKAIDVIRDDWKSVSDKFLETLSEHMQTDWPEDLKTITGYISINPICPRFLAKYSFFVNYRKSIEQSRETIAHEILHFLWFKKWKEVFPEGKSTEYESPNLVWRLSEIIDPIILQCNPQIRELIKPKKWGYESFRDLKIGDIGMTQYFAEVYMRSVKEGKSFEDILRVLWEEAQKHRAILEKF